MTKQLIVTIFCLSTLLGVFLTPAFAAQTTWTEDTLTWNTASPDLSEFSYKTVQWTEFVVREPGGVERPGLLKASVHGYPDGRVEGPAELYRDENTYELQFTSWERIRVYIDGTWFDGVKLYEPYTGRHLFVADGVNSRMRLYL